MIRVKMTKFVGVIISFVMALACFSFVGHNSVSATNTNMQYRRYDCGTGAITSYTLSSVPYNNNTRDISVPENRVPDPGNTAVVHITGSDSTGFIVGENVVATAAHCVANRSQKTFISNIKIDICEDSSNRVIARYEPISIHIPANYFNYTDEYKYSCYDYALIYIDTEGGDDLSKYGIFNLGVPTNGFLSNRTAVTATGFPDTTNGNINNTSASRYKSEGNIQFFTQDVSKFGLSFDLRFAATCVSSSGDSGGPLYTLTNSYNGENFVTVIGIVTGGGYDEDEGMYVGTYGVRMTTDLLHFYLNNSYL